MLYLAVNTINEMTIANNNFCVSRHEEKKRENLFGKIEIKKTTRGMIARAKYPKII